MSDELCEPKREFENTVVKATIKHFTRSQGAMSEELNDAQSIVDLMRQAADERQAQIVKFLEAMKRKDTNWPQYIAAAIARNEHLKAPE